MHAAQAGLDENAATADHASVIMMSILKARVFCTSPFLTVLQSSSVAVRLGRFNHPLWSPYQVDAGSRLASIGPMFEDRLRRTVASQLVNRDTANAQTQSVGGTCGIERLKRRRCFRRDEIANETNRHFVHVAITSKRNLNVIMR